MPLEHLHHDRKRASSFGADAEAYDAFRSGYPRALFDDLLEEPVQDALDVGCGTGKAALELVRRGIRVLGVDPDSRMAAVARRHGLDVDVDAFETWDPAGRRFDLITCGHAWHWIDAGAGPDKAADLLRPRGRIVRFWNYHVVPPALLERFVRIYAELAPAATVIGRDPSRDDDASDPFTQHPAFRTAPPRTYRWQRRLTGPEWVGLVGTFSDHQRLGSEALARLAAALEEAIGQHGGEVHVHGGTYVLTAWRR